MRLMMSRKAYSSFQIILSSFGSIGAHITVIPKLVAADIYIVAVVASVMITAYRWCSAHRLF